MSWSRCTAAVFALFIALARPCSCCKVGTPARNARAIHEGYMRDTCGIHAGYTRDACGKHEKYMRDTCICRCSRIHAGYMQEICKIHAEYMQDTCGINVLQWFEDT